MDKATYVALPGVEWVNGEPVPEDGKLELTLGEARFDLEQGRIVPEDGSTGAVFVEAEDPV